MRSVIKQTVVLPAPADALFEMYLDPAEHKTITGAEVTIGREIGCEFRAFDGMLTRVILAVIKRRLIAQSWRSALFKPAVLDSTLILTFTPQGHDVQITIVFLYLPS